MERGGAVPVRQVVGRTWYGPLWRRALAFIALVWFATTATFLLSSLVPGDFFTAFEANPNVRPELIAELRRQWGLHDPLYLQYLRWLGRSLRLDLGYSLQYQRPVAAVLTAALGNTLAIGLPALVFGLGFGVLLGTIHTLSERRLAGYLLDGLAALLLSLPALVLGIGALLLAASTGWFPLGGTVSLDSTQTGVSAFLDRVHHLVLPILCLTLPVLATIERIQHAATADAARELYFRAARARGLSRSRLFLNYLVRPSLNPVVSVLGPLFAAVLSGSLVLEQMFSWPGLGKATYDALFNRDIFLVLGCVVSASLLLAVGNLLSDLLLYIVDPRTHDPFLDTGA